VRSELFHVDVQTGMIDIIVTYINFTKAPRKHKSNLFYFYICITWHDIADVNLMTEFVNNKRRLNISLLFCSYKYYLSYYFIENFLN